MADAGEIKKLWVSITGQADDFYRTMSKVDSTIKKSTRMWRQEFEEAYTKPINFNSLKAVEKEMDTLKRRAQELRGAMLGATPSSPEAVKLATELRVVEQRMKAVDAAAAGAKERAERMRATMQKMSNGMLLFGGAVLGGAVAIGRQAMRVGDLAEELDNLSAKTGLSTDRLQVFKFIAEQNGLSFDTLANGMRMVQQRLAGVDDETGEAAKAFAALGVQIRDAQGNLLPMEQITPKLIEKLQGLGNATERNMYAAAIFGRGWGELAPILNMSAQEFKNAEEKAKSLGLVLSGKDLDNAREFDKAMDELRASTAGLVMTLAKDFMPIVKDLIERAKPVIDWISSWSDGTKTAVFNTMLWGGAISLIGGTALRVIGPIKTLFDVLKSLSQMKTIKIGIDIVRNILGGAVGSAAGNAAGSAIGNAATNVGGGAIGGAAARGGLRALGTRLLPLVAKSPYAIMAAEAIGIGYYTWKLQDEKKKLKREQDLSKSDAAQRAGQFQLARQHQAAAQSAGYSNFQEMKTKAEAGDPRALAHWERIMGKAGAKTIEAGKAQAAENGITGQTPDDIEKQIREMEKRYKREADLIKKNGDLAMAQLERQEQKANDLTSEMENLLNLYFFNDKRQNTAFLAGMRTKLSLGAVGGAVGGTVQHEVVVSLQHAPDWLDAKVESQTRKTVKTMAAGATANR